MHRIRTFVVVACVLVLGGCASGPGIPETSYFRLPPPATIERQPEPVFAQPVVVETFLADGLHSSQALLYAVDADATELRAYHYQLWVDPPVRMLQRRVVGALRRAGVAPLVVDRLASQDDAVRVAGRIERFERVPAGDGWRVSVALGLRADVAGEDRPRLVRRYHEDLAVEGTGIAASVRSFGIALDRILAAFVADLVRAGDAAVAPAEAPAGP